MKEILSRLIDEYIERHKETLGRVAGRRARQEDPSADQGIPAGSRENRDSPPPSPRAPPCRGDA
jgi:hypothetical protein